MTEPEIIAPRSLDDLTAARKLYPDARLVAGGTLELPRWRREGTPGIAIYLPAVRELHSYGENHCGAARTVAAIARDTSVHELLQCAALCIGTPAVRTLATLGGNIAAASPGCLFVALLALDGTATVLTPEQVTVRVSLADLTGAARQDLRRGASVLTSVQWTRARRATALQRATLRRGTGPVLGTVAVSRTEVGEGARTPAWRVAAGGADLPPQRLAQAELLLSRERADADETADQAAAELVLNDGNSHFGTPEYYRNLMAVLVRRAIGQILEGDAA